MTLGELIKNYRETHDLSMADFAHLSGMSRAYVSILEHGIHPQSGKVVSPSSKTLQQAASAMGMSVSDLMAKLETYDIAVDQVYPYKIEINKAASILSAEKLRRLLAYARFLNKEEDDDND